MIRKPRNPIDPRTLPEPSHKPLDYAKNRDFLLYQPSQKIPSRLEKAFVRYCRFSRILTVRSHAHTATLPDIKVMCGDEVIWHCLRCLQQCDNDVNMAQEAMEYLDSVLFDHALWLNPDQAARLSQHIATHGFAKFPEMMATVYIEYECRRDQLQMPVSENLRTLHYLTNYYQMWKVAFDGAKVMEKRFIKNVWRITDQENREQIEELRFKDPERLCPVCDKNYFTSGRKGLLHCLECDNFFALIEDFRKLCAPVTTSPIPFDWRNLHCFEPTPRGTTSSMVSPTRRSRSLPRKLPDDWTVLKAKRFVREAFRKRRASRRVAPSVNYDVGTSTSPPTKRSASTESIPIFEEDDSDVALPSLDDNAALPPFERNNVEVQATHNYNNLLNLYRQLNPTLGDFENRLAGSYNAETQKHYHYLRAKATLLCLENFADRSSSEITNTFAKIFNAAGSDIYAWASNAVQTNAIPNPAENPWISNGDGTKVFVMPPEYKLAAHYFKYNRNLQSQFFFK